MKRLLQLYKANAKRGEFRADASENAIYLYDFIAGDDFEAEFMGGTSPKQFIDQLAKMTGPVALHINSPGGDVFGGQAIATAIRNYKGGEITAYVDGIAASIASIIAVSCSKVVMASGAMMMIHKAWTIAMGNAEDFTETSALLKKIDGLLSKSYAAKSGKEATDFDALMAAETWLTPDECKDLGLCDEITTEAPQNAKAWDLSAFAKAPKPAGPSEAEIEAMVSARAAKLLADKEAADKLKTEESEQRVRRLAVALL